ncbi:Ig-like domain repeat protein [Streptomyces sp. NPDC051452]|uniref:Ig-like domain repeat protein n=1 Tax=Streptomyces sp. NPDC051452 TaxID=3365654 RepID=UPI0037AF95AA
MPPVPRPGVLPEPVSRRPRPAEALSGLPEPGVSGGVTPSQGPSSGGTRVTLTGHGFGGTTAVRFGSRSAAGFSVLDDRTIVAVTPAGSGVVPVTVITPGGTATLGQFFYQPQPGLKSARPGSGPLGGGNTVTLTGSNLGTATSVRFGSVVVTPVSASGQQVTVVAPPSAAPGTVAVTVTTAGGVSNPMAYTYDVSPTISGVYPASGVTSGGTVLLIAGSGLGSVTAVSVGGTPVRSFRPNSDALIVAVVPPGAPGPADVTVTSPSGTATAVGAFVYTIATGTTVTSSPDPSVTGQETTVTATVTPEATGAGTPGGTVTFDFGDGSAPVPVPVVDGTAACVHRYPATSGSPYLISASYSGDTGFAPSAGSTSHRVARAATVTTMTSVPDPSAVGQSVTIIAHVDAAAPGAGNPTGTVTFTFGDGTPPVTASLADHVATAAHTFTSTAGSPYVITATYRGDADFAASASPPDEHVVAADISETSTMLTSAPDPSVSGEAVTFTAEVTPVPPAAGTPTGSVSFLFRDGTSFTVALDADGTATTTHAYTDVTGSPYTALAVYSGDADFSSSSGTTTQTVGKAATTTSVTAQASPSVTGQTVTVTATVATVAPGAGTPTGTVTFAFGDATPPLTVPVTAGKATVAHAYTATSGSPYTVTATYNGDTAHAGSSGGTAQQVQPATTTTSVALGATPSVSGQAVPITATVAPLSPGAGVPSGTVTFTFGDGSDPVTVPLIAGIATTAHTYTSTSGSPYTVTATYGGGSDFGGSSGTAAQTVAKSATTTTVATAPNPSTAGRQVTVTVAVGARPPGSGAPEGTVTVDFGDGTAPDTVTLVGGTAVTVHTYRGTVGSPYPVTAAYSGNADFAPSSGGATQTVGRASTTMSVTGAPQPSVVGQPVTFTATVAPSAGTGTASGPVRFDFGDGTPPVMAALVAGTATVQHAYTSASDGRTVTASYGGDPDFTGCSGTAVQTVRQALTTTTVSQSPAASVTGQQITVTASVYPVPPGSGDPSGTVTFDFGDGTRSVGVPVIAGTATATHTYTTASASPYAVIATYGGDPDFTGSSGGASHTVDRGASVTTISTSPDPSVTGQDVTVTATVTPTAPAGGTPTGTVTFDFGDGTAPVTSPLVAGVATLPHSYATTSSSPYTVTAAYGGDIDFTGSSGSTFHSVARAGTETTLTSSPDPSAVGQPVTLLARVVAAAPGVGSPTGTVTFTFDDGTPDVTAPVVNHIATVSHTFTGTAGSPFAIKAVYAGDQDFAPSTSPAVDHVVSASVSQTSVTVTSGPNPSVTGQPVVFTATVTPVPPAAGTPTGSVTFFFRDGTSSTVALSADGTATTTHAYTSVSGTAYEVTAVYSGDADFSSSIGTTTQTVNPAGTTTAVVSSPSPSVSGQPVTLTATVVTAPPGAGAPTGTVTFAFGDGSPSVTAALNAGIATLIHTYTTTSGSPYTVTATYNGASDFSSSSGTTTQTVVRTATTTTVVSSPKPSVSGQPVTLTAVVASNPPGAGAPTGTVTFAFGDGSPSVTAPLTAGTATTSHVYASAAGGPCTVTAAYSGDSDRAPSSGSVTQTVNPALTSTAVSTSSSPSRVGQAVTASATVTTLSPGAGTPTGTVTFSFGDGATVTTALNAGTATAGHTYTTRAGSPYIVTATYNGTGDFTASNATTTQTVAQTSTTTAVTSGPSPAVTGQPVTVSATVSAVAPGAGTPSGNVTFSFGDGTSPVTAALTGSTATVTHAYTSVTGSPFTNTAAYNGDTNYTGSTGTTTQAVGQAATTTTVSASPNPATHTQPVTVTVTVAPTAPGAGVPTGTVTVAVSGEKPQTVTLVSGTASVAYPRLNKGAHTIDTAYSGDGNYAASTGSGTVTVT